MRRTLPLLLGALLIAVSAGCGDEDADVSTGDGSSTTQSSGSGSTAAPGGTNDLEGRTFLSQSVTVDGADEPLVAGTQIRLTFEDGSLGASAGCNSFGGAYGMDGDVLTVAPMGGTEMGCDQARMDQDTWLTELLASAPKVALDGDELVITAGDTVIELLDEETADPDRDLVGTRWNLASLLDGTGSDSGLSSVPDGVDAWIELAADGTFTAELGCNAGGGDYTVDGDRLVIDSMEQNTAACVDGNGDPDERSAVEAAVTATLRANPTFTIDADTLSLRTTEGGLDFIAADSAGASSAPTTRTR